MKNAKKLVALLLSLALVLSLGACGGNDGSSTSSEASPSSTTEESGAAAESGDESQAETAETGEFQLPIVDEPTTLSYFVADDSNAAIMTTDWNDNEFYQEMERRTGVHLEFEMVSSADYQTNFNLMIASGNLADMIYVGASYYAEGVDAAIDDGYFLDLTDLVDEYMPNYEKVRTSDVQYELLSTTDSGRLGAVYELRQSKQGPWLGLWIRQDWLDDLGLDTPVTFDDYHEVLTAFKNEKGATAPLILNFSGSDGEFGTMSGGLNVLNSWQLDETGKVNFGPYMDAWKEYVTIMHQWYTEGLIDPDFMATDERTADMAKVVTGASGLFAALYTMPSVYEAASEDPNMNLAPVNPPVMNEGDEGHIRLRDSYTSGNTAISADSENWEVALRWLDYLYTDEGALLANYGVEGDTFEFDENGKPVFTDKILNNENGWTMTQTVASYLCPSAGIANWSDWTRELAGVPEKDQACYDVWSEFSDDWRLPSSVTLTQDESTERAALYADISTIVKEQTAQFISGALDIEENWDAYISALEASGMERAIEITQAAYDRYLARVE
ncbi:extracellular solute-binding protein [Acutalibacter sp. LFL-21]|uniref:extracellular solute-binding protein n=1 Tax=Acutalibacter sp. LFL-21 TaxID=2983399 RepID=UPI0021D67C89|nr:extracellular solute-binding protein [Acutalibacter sp. LFL-21]MCU7651219.1 extracellular solute-binding protein [Acutalibacter sp. LFL-21]